MKPAADPWRSALLAQEAMGYRQVMGDCSLNLFVEDVSARSFLIHRVNELLQRPDDEEPVTVLDVGAGAALTMYELAGMHADAVDAGRLTLNATNRNGRPQDFMALEAAMLDELQREHRAVGVAPQRLEYCKDISQQHHDRLQLHVADFTPRECFDGRGHLPNLTGRVDIIHESKAVTAWSRKPGSVIRHLGTLVSPRGLYMVDSEDIGTLYHKSRSLLGEYRNRVKAIELAHNYLVNKLGLEPIGEIEAGPRRLEPAHYMMFKGPEAPPITLGVPSASVVQ